MTFFESVVIILLLSILTTLCMFMLGVNNDMGKLGKTEGQVGSETIKLIAEMMNSKIKIKKDNKRIRPKNSEVNRLWCNNSKALTMLKWKPKYNNLPGFKKGLNETINWYSNKNNLSLYKSDIYNL